MLTNTSRSAIQPYSLIDMLHRISVERYHAMIRTGILNSDDHVELIDGMILQKMPKNPFHRAITWHLRNAIDQILPVGWYVDSQEPITTTYSEPEPNIVVVQGKTSDYLDGHPTPKDIGLVVEVSDATLSLDQTIKLQMYARAGIVQYWVINVQSKQFEVYTRPNSNDASYEEKKTFHLNAGDGVSLTLDGKVCGEVQLSEIFPN